jgi:hypothetical protein
LETAARNLVQWPADCLDDHRSKVRAAELAEQGWINFYGEHPGASYTPDFERGFLDGYADFLYAGSPGLPPALPPKDYQRPRYQTPEGHQAILDWYEGFARGVAAAKASGLRQLMVIPPSGAVVDLPASRMGPMPLPPVPSGPLPLTPAEPHPEHEATPPPKLLPSAVETPAPSNPRISRGVESGPSIGKAAELGPPNPQGGYVSWKPAPLNISPASTGAVQPVHYVEEPR